MDFWFDFCFDVDRHVERLTKEIILWGLLVITKQFV